MLSNQRVLEEISVEINRLASEIEVAQTSLNSDLSSAQKEQLQQNVLAMNVRIAKLQKGLEPSDDYQRSLLSALREKQEALENIQTISMQQKKDYGKVFYRLAQRIIDAESMLELQKSIEIYNKKEQEFLQQDKSQDDVVSYLKEMMAMPESSAVVTLQDIFKTLIKCKEDHLVQLAQPVDAAVELSEQRHEIAMNKLRAIKSELEQNPQKISSTKLYTFYTQLNELEEECQKEFLFQRVTNMLKELIAEKTSFLQQIQNIKMTLDKLDSVIDEQSKNLAAISQIHESIPSVISKIFANFEDDDVVTPDAVLRMGQYADTVLPIEKMKDLQKEAFLYFENKVRNLRQFLEFKEAEKKLARDIDVYRDQSLTFGSTKEQKGVEIISQSQPSYVKSIYQEIEESPDFKQAHRNRKLKVVKQQDTNVAKQNAPVPPAASSKLGKFGNWASQIKNSITGTATQQQTSVVNPPQAKK